MNSKAQTLPLAILSAVFIFIVGFMMINFLMPEIATFRAEMSCASPNDISDGVKVLCLVADIAIPYWILIVFSLAIGGLVYFLSL